EFPYTFEGHVFDGPSTIIDTVGSTAGCDTIRTITVTELPLFTTTVNIEVCASEFPYTFEEIVSESCRTSVDTAGSTAGCDTIMTITVTELPLFTTTVDIAVCASEFPYTFEGHVFDGPSTIIDTVGSTAGCDTIRTITVTELPLFTTTVNIEVCASEFPYTFEGHTFATPGTITDTVGSTAGCDTVRRIT